MSHRSRYILIAFGFLIFLLLAPLTVLYVRGINYDYASGQFFRTGILAVRSEPSNAVISLNGKLVREKSGDIKFLKPGSYDVTVSNPEFQDWSKRLTVLTDQVTWASPAPNKIFMFLKKPETKELGSLVLDFAISGDSVLSLQNEKLSVFSSTRPFEKENFSLPIAVNHITPGPENRYFLLDDTAASKNRLVFDAREKKIYDISSLFVGPAKLFWNNSGSLYSIENGLLYEVSWREKSKKVLLQNIRTAIMAGNTAYVIQGKNRVFSLDAIELSSNREQTLVQNLPEFSTSEILVNDQKQILLLLDSTLYHVNSGLKKITENVSESFFDTEAQNLIVTHSGELSLYSFEHGSLDFITRSGQRLQNARINGFTSYAFFFKDNKLTAAELDTRDHQNQYELYSATKAEKFYVDEEAKHVVVLDDGELKLVKIRK